MMGHGEAPVINRNRVHSYENVHAQKRDPENTGGVDNALYAMLKGTTLWEEIFFALSHKTKPIL